MGLFPEFRGLEHFACDARPQRSAARAASMIACALERYQLAHGDYPETLDALVPRFIEAIPNDVIGGKPPHYRRSGAGTYLLYSIGWSGQESEGVSKPNDTGDWVWPEAD